MEIDTGNFGCCAFTAATPEGQRIFGRNFDYEETDVLVFYTNPKYGYASYGVTDLKFFDIGAEQSIDGNSVAAKAFMLAAPYVTMDGINEAGVGVGILQLDIDELVRTDIVLNLPFVFLCREDCKGICAGCGKMLNYENCICEKEIDPRLAVLDDFFN